MTVKNSTESNTSPVKPKTPETLSPNSKRVETLFSRYRASSSVDTSKLKPFTLLKTTSRIMVHQKKTGSTGISSMDSEIKDEEGTIPTPQIARGNSFIIHPKTDLSEMSSPEKKDVPSSHKPGDTSNTQLPLPIKRTNSSILKPNKEESEVHGSENKRPLSFLDKNSQKPLEVKHFSKTGTISFEITAKEFSSEFLKKDSFEQIKEIFEKNPLNETQKEKKARALVYLTSRLENSVEKKDREEFFQKVEKWVFYSKEQEPEKPKIVDQCLEILLDFSLYENAASFLCELATVMETDNLHALAFYIYSKHSDKMIFLKHTIKLFTNHDLMGSDMETAFRGPTTLSSKLLSVCMEVFLSQELSDLVTFLNKKIEQPKKYYDPKKECYTSDGEKMIEACLEKILALKLEDSKAIIKLRCELIASYFFNKDKTVDTKAAMAIGIRETLFLRGINMYLLKQIFNKTKDPDAQKIVSKLTKLLQALSAHHKYEQFSGDTSLNKLISKYQAKIDLFIDGFLK